MQFAWPRDMFADKSFDNARRTASNIADYLRYHGPFEPHRLPLDEMEYTTMPEVMQKLHNRFVPMVKECPIKEMEKSLTR